MNIPDHISESLERIFCVKIQYILKFFESDPDPGIFLTLCPDPGWKNIAMHCKKSGNLYLCVGAAD